MQYGPEMSNDKDQNTMINAKPVENWLFLSAFMVLAMAVIGAVTRLTESGLSMVEWRPLVGMIPPLNDADWTRVFDLYRDTPEFAHKNSWMELADFKAIFFWEWLHRFWGRMIGIVYALPLLYFWVRKQIPRGYGFKLLVGLLLGGAQGLMGWYMVKSGLIDRPSVSHYRLAAHLSLAFLIFGYLLWLAFDLQSLNNRNKKNCIPRENGDLKTIEKDSRFRGKNKNELFCLKRHSWITMFFVCTTIIWGAFVAGLDGGMVYNSWPLMGGHLVPPDVTGLSSLHVNPAAVQFFHRWIAVITGCVALSFAWRVKSYVLALAIFLQIGLGLTTLLTQVFLPVAALHQAGAFFIFAAMIYQLQGLHKKAA